MMEEIQLSISSLAEYQDFVSCGSHYNYRQNSQYNPSGKVSKITIHHSAGVTSLEEFSSILRSRNVSWTYAIDVNGKIGCYLDEGFRPWTSSSRNNDYNAVTIEVSNSSIDGNWPISDASYSALLNLCEDICRRNSISELVYTGRAETSNLTMHKWFEATICPGPYLSSKFPDIARTVSARLKGMPTYSPLSITPNAYQAANGQSNLIVNIDNIIGNSCPYIATLSHTSTSRISSAWKTKCGISGVVLEAGSLYDIGHNLQSRFESNRLKQQVKDAKAAGLPIGLYMEGRAHTSKEALREMYYLSFVVSKYIPEAGMWIHPIIFDDRSKTDDILNTYLAELTRLGLKAKIGLKVNKYELGRLNWSYHQNNWFLWLEDNVSDFDNLKYKITPQFFLT